MDNKTARNWVIGIIFIAAILIVGNYFLPLSVGTEFGWFPFTQVNDQFTNLAGPVSIPNSISWTSKFWNVNLNGNQYLSLPVSGGLTGGDGSVTITCWKSGGDRGYGPYGGCNGLSATFNENIKGKYFRVNYDFNSNFGKFYGQGTSTGTIEYVPSVMNPEQSELFVNGQDRGVVTAVNGIMTFSAGVSNQDGGCGTDFSCGSATLTLSNPRYKPAFDCAVDNDEVSIFDEFTSGSIIDITKLSYPVKKFCINQPVVIRSFTETGIGVDTNNEIMIKLSQGGSVTVKENQTIRIPYITQTQTGLLRCSVNQAFNTNTKLCEDITSKGTEEDRGTVVKPVEIGTDELAYIQNYQSSSLTIGDIIITPSAPSYTCECTENTGTLYPPSPSESCWNTQINGEPILYGQDYAINNYLKLNFFDIQGKGAINDYYYGIKYNCAFPPEYWTNVFKIKIDKEGLKISSIPSLSNTIIPGNKYIIDIGVLNNLANFQKSGFKIRTINNFIGSITEEYQQVPFNLGQKIYQVTVSTSYLGDTTFEIIPYVEVNDKKLFGSSMVTYSYVEKNITQVITQIENCKQIGCPSGAECLSSGSCLIKTISDCKTNGCPPEAICQADGNCLIKATITLVKTCKELGCPSGQVCQENGNCLEQKTVIKEVSAKTNYILIGSIIAAILFIALLIWLYVRSRR